jgi:hypothetical protein
VGLTEIPDGDFDAVVCMDNALPHFESDEELFEAATQIRRKLRAGASFMGSIRDYDSLVQERPVMQGPTFYSDQGSRRIVHQVWDWSDERRYAFHLYITSEVQGAWETQHYVSKYRAVLREEFSRILEAAGFVGCRWILTADPGCLRSSSLLRNSAVPSNHQRSGDGLSSLFVGHGLAILRPRALCVRDCLEQGGEDCLVEGIRSVLFFTERGKYIEKGTFARALFEGTEHECHSPRPVLADLWLESRRLSEGAEIWE